MNFLSLYLPTFQKQISSQLLVKMTTGTSVPLKGSINGEANALWKLWLTMKYIFSYPYFIFVIYSSSDTISFPLKVVLNLTSLNNASAFSTSQLRPSLMNLSNSMYHLLQTRGSFLDQSSISLRILLVSTFFNLEINDES